MKTLTKCANGCNASPCPPSKVVCGNCLDKITNTLRDEIARLEKGVPI